MASKIVFFLTHPQCVLLTLVRPDVPFEISYPHREILGTAMERAGLLRVKKKGWRSTYQMTEIGRAARVIAMAKLNGKTRGRPRKT